MLGECLPVTWKEPFDLFLQGARACTSFRFAEAAEAPQQTLVGIAAGLIKDLCLFVLKTLLNSFVTPQPIPCLY